MMDSANYPLYIHCNQGRHRTGCVIACLRKIQRWPMEDILAEYHAYANPKARPGDIDMIHAFDPEAVFEFAKTHGYLANMKRMDSAIANIDALAEALSDSPPYCDEIDLSIDSNASTISDVAIEMKLPILSSSPLSDTQNKRPSLTRTTSQQHAVPDDQSSSHERGVHAEAAAIGGPLASSTAGNASETTTSVIELSEDLLTPPADSAMKMLGAS